MLSDTPVIWTGPFTRPATIRLLLMFLRTRPGNGAPVAVGMDMSTIHRFKSVKLPAAVALAADDGRMM